MDEPRPRDRLRDSLEPLAATPSPVRYRPPQTPGMDPTFSVPFDEGLIWPS